MALPDYCLELDVQVGRRRRLDIVWRRDLTAAYSAIRTADALAWLIQQGVTSVILRHLNFAIVVDLGAQPSTEELERWQRLPPPS